MYYFQTFIFLIAAAVLLVGAAQKLRIPYPFFLLLGGVLLGHIPGLGDIPIDPNLILVVVLPPILYYEAFWISFQEFKKNARQILSLAIGLVVVTTIIIALVFKWLFPELSWALAFAFGAIVSPSDIIAASAILKRFSIGSRLFTILEGESLVNDAFALVFYKLSVAALLTGYFSWSEGIIEFFKVVIGGIIVGFITGYIAQRISHKVLSPVASTMFSFSIPYITYILADSIEVSGVLAVIINGEIISRMFIKHAVSLRRVIGVSSWDIFIIFLHCIVFILLGLQLDMVTRKMTFEQMAIYSGYAAFITFLIIAIRMIWVFGDDFLLHSLKNRQKNSSTFPLHLKESLIIGWTGMRGIITMVAVLGLPFFLASGEHVEGREIVIFITFVVILLTLFIPGLTLPYLLKKLKVGHIASGKKNVTHTHREKLLKTAEREIQLAHELNEQERAFLKNYFTTRHRILEMSALSGPEVHRLELARHKVLQAQRKFLVDMWEKNEIDDVLLKILELELDLEESLSIRAEIK